MTGTYADPRETDIVLRDGSSVHVRPARRSDRAAILHFLEQLSVDSRRLRFFSAGVNLPEMAEQWSAPTCDRCSLIALAGIDSRVVAHALYERASEDRAEVAFVVANDYLGRGIGTQLLARLAGAAREDGISMFEAYVLPENARMIEVFRESGLPVRLRSQPGQIRVELSTFLSEEALERFERREQIAAAAAMRTVLAPRSVALIGASRRRGTLGGEAFNNLVAGGFTGALYPINPNAPAIQGVPAFPSISAVPDQVDMAVIAVPAPLVVSAARECAEKRVKGLVVISAGFAELGEEGAQRQRELLAICRAAGMRLIGPNSMGLVNTSPEVRLNTTFSPNAPIPGPVGFFSQSGALGSATLDYAASLGLGLSSFISAGNQADLSVNDFLNYWEDDPETGLVLLYLESVAAPRAFARVARRVARRKPIVALASGRSTAGARATSSHTGSLLGASDLTIDALFRQSGVIRADTLEELLDIGSLLANQPWPAGRRVAIVTNGGGPGILCADACEQAGLLVPPLGESLRQALAAFLPAEAGLNNPVDMIASATAEDYRRAVTLLASDPGIDACIVIFVPPLVTRVEDAAAAIHAAAAALPRPIPLITVVMSSSGVPDELGGGGLHLPCYRFPEDAARVLACAAAYADWRSAPEGNPPAFDDLQRGEAAGCIARALAPAAAVPLPAAGSISAASAAPADASQGGAPAPALWLDPDAVAQLLAAYRLPLAEWRLADDPAAAGRAAAELGGTVVVKAMAPELVHKTEAGAVALSISGERAAHDAAAQMVERLARLGIRTPRFLVQRMVQGGVEVLVGVVSDLQFGPVLACAAGGTAADLRRDVAVRLTPIMDRDASDMIRSLAIYPLLDGYRGAPRTDIEGLADVLLRVSVMVETHPEIVELDLNPVIVRPEGPMIVDARVRLEFRERP